MNRFELSQKIKKNSTVNREMFIQNICKNKNVLDLGCIRHSAEYALQDANWLHKKIAAVAKRAIGIDYLEEEVRKLNEKGWKNIQYGDVTMPLAISVTFDVIVAGDLIEHLTNFSGFFENCLRLLKDNGLIVISTPNPFFNGEFHYVSFKRQYVINPEHTCWIDPQALSQLAGRFGLVIDDIHFIKTSWKLGNLMPETINHNYDILNGKWNNVNIMFKMKSIIWGAVFGLFYPFFTFITGTNSNLVKYSDYIVILKRNE